MVQFYKAKSATKKTQSAFDSFVTGIDHKLCGIVHHQQNTLFVERVLPNEQVRIKPLSNHQGQLVKLLKPSEQRIKPRCHYFERCGGCQAQMLSADDQLAYKRQEVGRLLKQFSGYEQLPDVTLLQGEVWNYRRDCRLSSWFVPGNGWQLGFRMPRAKKLVPMTQCETLSETLNPLLQPLQKLLASWPKTVRLGHIELIDVKPQPIVAIRLMKPLTSAQCRQCEAFAKAQQVAVVFDLGEERQWLVGEACYYTVDDVELHFSPGDFIQVNAGMNQQLVALALDWLDPQADERLLDLFSGIGNFTLPLAKRAKEVIAIEGVESMAQRVSDNARRNGLQNVTAFSGDLNDPSVLAERLKDIDKVLLDPARAGAKTAIGLVAKARPKAVLYIACDPATMARDVAQLQAAGYCLNRWALIDMFAQTSHVETAALFTVA